MNKVFSDIFFEMLGKMLISLVLALICTGALFFDPDVFWNGSFLASCITVASILCAYEGIHQGVLVSNNTKFISTVRTGRYKKSFTVLSMMPLAVSLAFILWSLLIFVCTCTGDGPPVQMHDCKFVFFVWSFLFFAMICIFLHVHLLCLRIISEDN